MSPRGGRARSGLVASCLPAPSELLVLAAAVKCLLGRAGKGREGLVRAHLRIPSPAGGM